MTPTRSSSPPASSAASDALGRLARRIARCRACPRLVAHRERVAAERVARFRDQTYWGRPVPGFGDPQARLLVVGLAPAAHGGNRTGRVFTGDESGNWLYRALHAAGFANQPTSTHRDDGLRLAGAYVTAIARCAPPGNRPTPAEIARCRPFLLAELRSLPRLAVVVVLGKIAHDGFLAAERARGHDVQRPAPRFAHGAEHRLPSGLVLLCSYHPSQQNTFTGRLTRPMLDAVFSRAAAVLGTPGSAPAPRRR
ncbi:MAG TPA: uracil-DNA glycosylase [Candidatus Eisenbacteria bacterium]|nr:uracil-DNA glycosylase [Candidatus Eisenbacteria bacterium]